MKTNSLSVGRIILTIVALYAAGGSYIFDWNHTHIYNLKWPPHAKFHNAQTMLLGTCLGLSSVWTLWAGRTDALTRLRYAILLASLYWLTQMGAILFPGTALADPEFARLQQLPAQLIVDVVMLILLAVAYPLELHRLKRA
jgi:hypothetical protein